MVIGGWNTFRPTRSRKYDGGWRPDENFRMPFGKY